MAAEVALVDAFCFAMLQVVPQGGVGSANLLFWQLAIEQEQLSCVRWHAVLICQEFIAAQIAWAGQDGRKERLRQSVLLYLLCGEDEVFIGSRCDAAFDTEKISQQGGVIGSRRLMVCLWAEEV